MKKILIITIISFLIFFIYLNTIDRKIYFVAMGDAIAKGLNSKDNIDIGYNNKIKEYLNNKQLLENYIDNYIEINYRTTDLINLINNNEKLDIKGKKITVKNSLIKADVITLSIGLNDFIYYLNTNKKNMLENLHVIKKDIEKLLQLIREYSKEDVILIGIYNPYIEHKNIEEIEEVLNKLNNEIEEICIELKVEYINIYEEMKNKKNIENTSVYPTESGYNMIYEKVKEKLDNPTYQ